MVDTKEETEETKNPSQDSRENPSEGPLQGPIVGIQQLIAFALKNPVLIFAFVGFVIVLGVLSYRSLNIEAYPNPVPPMVEVIVQPEGWSAEEVEEFITIPMELGLSGMPGAERIRSQSIFGLSDIKCYFSWGTSYETARQEVINRLPFIELPQGIHPQISPWNAVGEIFRYTLVGEGYSLEELKTAQDWVLTNQLKQVPGVIDVVSFGGETKQYHVEVNPLRLREYGVTLNQVTSALQNANQNVGGERLTVGEQSYTIRGIGLYHNTREVAQTVITTIKGVPIRVEQVAEVKIGAAPRLGRIGKDEVNDVVEGIVLMRYGAETQRTLDGVRERLEQIRRDHLLSPGMEVKPYYDRGDLVKTTTRTVMENLFLGMVLVCAVLFLFLGHARAALITSLTIPLALMFAFFGLILTKTSANLVSLGAIDFGIVVDSTVIMIENIFRHLGKQGQGSVPKRILVAAKEVAGPMTFATLIIGVSFLPMLTLTGVSGIIFAPMARTYAFAIFGAIFLALTLTPVLAGRLISPQAQEKESFALRALHRLYHPLFHLVLRWPKVAALSILAPVFLCFFIFPLLGREFMPKLEEGNLWIRATLPVSISIEESGKYVDKMRAIIQGCDTWPCPKEKQRHPEIVTVVSQLGRPDDGTDVTGFFNIEIFAPLKPFDAWPRGKNKQTLTEELTRELKAAFPGVIFNFSQMISDNVEEALAGIKGENSVKVIGPDLIQNEAIADKIIDTMTQIRGIKDLGKFSSLGQPSIQIIPDRILCSRYGLNTGDVTAIIQAAVGGQTLTEIREDEKVFDLTVRWLPSFRNSIQALREIEITSPDGIPIPLHQIAQIKLVDGPATIYRENGHRYTPVKFSVRERDLVSTVEEAKSQISRKVPRPYEVHLEWSGELNELNEAETRLLFIIPLTLLVIVLLTYTAVRTWLDTLIVLINIPVACSGGLLALWLTKTHFSISAAMGFLSVFGIAIQDAILVVTYFQRLRKNGLSIIQAAQEAAEKRFRPVLMTTLVATLGLLPAALSNGIGAQTQRPLALVVIGGSLMLALLTRLLQPSLLIIVHRFTERLAIKSDSSL